MSNPKTQVAAKLRAILAAAPAALFACSYATQAEATTENHYGVTISTDPTQNMSFDNGVYTATADSANLNVTDLENALAIGRVEVTTGNGVGGDQKGDLHVNAAFAWTTGHALTLDAYHSLLVNAAALDAEKGGLALVTNDGGTGGTFVYGPGGNITIRNLQNMLKINGERYLLDRSIKSLAGDIEANPAGRYVLADSYDASQDGTYTASPITTTFTGLFDGLGNAISNLTIDAGTTGGLFLQVSGTVRDLHLENASVTQESGLSWVGTLVGVDTGLIENVTVGGSVKALSGFYVGGLSGSNSNVINCSSSATVLNEGAGGAGGLTGYAGGTLSNSFATGSVTAKKVGYAGGLVGVVQGTISDAFATGPVMVNGAGDAGGLVGFDDGGAISAAFATGSVAGADRAKAGGLVGAMVGGSINNSYSTGAIVGGLQAKTGGLIGDLEKGFTPSISASYSTGAVSADAQSWIGGLVGFDRTNGQTGCGCFTDTYWDTDTSGITDPGQGSGNIPNEAGITGLTTKQFQSGLPPGFDPAIWAEKRKIDHHLPYLISNPPPQ